MPAGCEEANWQVEEHTFYGKPEQVRSKIAGAQLSIGRRLFTVITEGAGTGNVHEFELVKGNRYRVRTAKATPAAAQSLNAAITKTVVDNQGRGCVGKLVQELPGFKELHFGSSKEEDVDPSKSFANLVGKSAEEANQFFGVSFHLLC